MSGFFYISRLVLPCDFFFFNYYFITPGTAIGVKTQVKAGIHPGAIFCGQSLRVGLGNPDPDPDPPIPMHHRSQLPGNEEPRDCLLEEPDRLWSRSKTT